MTERRTIPDLSERKESLWILPAAPAIWAAHFFLAYGTAALWCGKFAGPGASLSTPRTAIAVYTVLALAGVSFIGFRGYRRHAFGESTLPHDFDSSEDRHRFLGFATLLLSLLSAVAILYAALAAVVIRSCD